LGTAHDYLNPLGSSCQQTLSLIKKAIIFRLEEINAYEFGNAVSE